MLGLYVMGFSDSLAASCFAALTAVCLAAAYTLMGATWLIIEDRRRAAAPGGRLGPRALVVTHGRHSR
jgi:cytochrome bd-type quinol oxidase subunit 2